jgi:polysaccharide export outer membrane protein
MVMRPYHGAAFLLLALVPAAASAQPAAAQVPELQAPSASPASAYRINPGDELEIYVWGEERLQRTVKVLPDGTIAFPLVGQMVAQGFLPQELEASISNGLRSQYRGQVPQVTVSVATPSGMQLSVLGRVRSPGNFTPGRYVNVLEALSLAGGPNEFANLDNILIIRKVGDQVQTLRVGVAPLFKGSSDSSAVARTNLARLETGDTIIVP